MPGLLSYNRLHKSGNDGRPVSQCALRAVLRWFALVICVPFLADGGCGEAGGGRGQGAVYIYCGLAANQCSGQRSHGSGR